MKLMGVSKKVVSGVVLFLFVVSFLLVQGVWAQGGAAITSSSSNGLDDNNSPVRAHVSLDKIPRVDETAQVSCVLTSVIDAPDTTAEIELPGSAEVVSGDVNWVGDLAAGGPQTLNVRVIFRAEGDTAVRCRVHYQLDANNSFGDLAAVYLTIGQDQSRAGFAPVPVKAQIIMGEQLAAGDGSAAPQAANDWQWNYEGREMPPAPALAPGLEGVETMAAAPDAVDGDLTVTGYWYYYDRDDSSVGIREQQVEIVRGDNGDHIAWCWTGLDGYFSCGPFTNPGTAGVRAIVWAYSNYLGDVLRVKNPDYGGTYDFGVQTSIQSFSDGTHNLGSWTLYNDSAYERAYWAQRDLVDTYRFIYFSGDFSTMRAGPGTVLWKIDSTDGTYYSLGGEIHIKGEDPLSDTTVIHEYTHNIMYNVYSSYPATPNCSPHYIDLQSSTGCAWSEGFAEFIPSVVNNDPTYRWASGASLDLEGPTWPTSGWDDGDAVEGRVAGALWDIYDGANEGDDQYSEPLGFEPYWDVFYNQDDSNFADFWAAWRSYGYDNSSAGPLMSMFQSTINYRLGPGNDDFLNAYTVSTLPYTFLGLNTTNATTQGNDPDHPCGSTVYPKQSRSVWFKFTPGSSRQYQIHTGGSDYDTVLGIWSGSFGALTNVGCDDDGGFGTTSELFVSLNSGTTYYIEVTQFSSANGGNMDLSISNSYAGEDVFWYAAGPNADYLARSNGNGTFAYLAKPVGGTYTPLVGNFAGDEAKDIFWYAPGSAPDFLWTATSNGNFSESTHSVSGTYQPFLGDFNNDGFTDIFWYAPGPAADYLAYSYGNGTFSYQAKPVGGTYIPLVGDFAGSAAMDIFWYAPGASPDYLWTAYIGNNFSETALNVSGTYTPLLGDFNWDLDTDIFWYAPGPDSDWLALSNGDNTFTYLPKSVGGTYTPLVGNFSGGGGDDIFWYAPGPGGDYLWTSTTDGSFTEAARGVSGTYTPLLGDFDYNHYTDIFWYAPGSAADYLALSAGNTNFTYIAQSIGGTYTPLIGNFDSPLASSAPLSLSRERQPKAK